MQPFQRTAAVFDIDDSLLDGNAGTIFTWFLYSNREMAPQVRSQVPRGRLRCSTSASGNSRMRCPARQMRWVKSPSSLPMK